MLSLNGVELYGDEEGSVSNVSRFIIIINIGNCNNLLIELNLRLKFIW